MKKLVAMILVIGFLLATWGAGQAALIGYWPLEETSGTIAPNLAPGGTDGTLSNGPVWTTDPTRGQVLSFDGGDDYVSAGSIPAIAQFDDFTWAFWTYQQQTENNDVIVGNRYGGSGWVKFTANAFEYRSADGGDINYANIAQNAWVHHAVVKTGDTFVYYRDGADSGLSSTTTGDGGVQPFFLGGDSGGERWQGRLDDVGIWTEALSAGDINTIYTGGIAALLTPVLTWDGVANGNWSDSARWAGTKPPNFPDATVKAAVGPMGANNTVTVNGNYGAHSVDVTNNGALIIGSGNTLDVVNSLNAAGHPVTMHNNSTLLVGAPSTIGSLTTQGNATLGGAGDVTVSGSTFDGGGATGTFTKTGPGTLSLDNSGGTGVIGVQNMTFDVNEGTLFSKGAQPLGGTGPTTGVPAGVILSGGLLSVEGPDVITPNTLGMAGFMNDGRQNSDLDFSNGGGLLADTPVGERMYSGAIDINGDGAFRGLIPEITRNDDYQTLWTGTYTVAAAGNHRFEMTNKDDKTVIWLDLDGDGVFSHSGTAGDEQMFGLDNGNRTVTLAAGSYDVALGHMEHGGGSRIRALVQTPTLSNRVINPGEGAQAGIWSAVGIGGIDMTGTPISVTANSGLHAVTEAPPAAFGPLTLNDGTTLTTSGADMTFSSVAVAGGAGRRGTLALENNVTMSNYADGGAAIVLNGGDLGLSSTGGGATFDNAVALSAPGTITAGAIAGGVPGQTVTLGSAGNNVTVAAGNTLTMRSTDNYSLNVAGQVNGGNLEIPEGTVALSGGGTVDNMEVKTAATASTPGVTITDGGRYTARDGDLTVSGSGAPFDVGGDNMAAGPERLGVHGGTVTVRIGGMPGGLAVWLDASDVDGQGDGATGDPTNGQPVATWADKSGNGNNATQSTTGNQPVMVVSSGLNAKPALRFAQDNDDNGDIMRLGDLSAQFPTGATLFTAITSNEGGNTRYNIFGNRGDNDERWVAENWNESRPGSFRTSRSSDGSWTYSDWLPDVGNKLIALESDSSVYRMLIDGTEIGSDSPAYHSGSGADWAIANRANTGQAFNGDIAEMLLFDRVLTAAEANAVGGYLAAKYAITAPNYTGNIAPPPINLPYTDIEVSVDSTLLSDTPETATYGDLAMGPAVTTLTLSGAPKGISFDVVSGNATVNLTDPDPDNEMTIRGGINPGDSVGVLSIGGDLVVEDGVVYDWELGPKDGTPRNDLVQVDGTLTFDLVDENDPPNEQEWILRLVDAGGESHFTEKLYLFTGLPQGEQNPLDLNGDWQPYDIDTSLVSDWMFDESQLMIGLDNIGLYLTGLQTVPEPGTLVLLALGGLGLLVCARRRRRAR